MLDIREIDAAIAKFEARKNHDAAALAYLSYLYTIKDHISKDTAPYAAQEKAAEPERPKDDLADVDFDSDFADAIRGMTMPDVLRIVAEVVDTIHVVNPRLYDGLLRRISAVKNKGRG